MNDQLHVLVVEDNPADADLIREILPETGPVSFGVDSAPRLSDALARLKRGGLDLIIVDLGLPDSQGIDTFFKLRDAAPDIAIIVVTGNDDLELALTAVREGAQDYLVKGQIGGGILMRAARYAVERRLEQEEIRQQETELVAIYENAPIVMLLVDAERRIIKVNEFGAVFSGRPIAEMCGLRSGEALRCLYALDDPRGCGFGPHCSTCLVRTTIENTLETGTNHHDVEMTMPFGIGDLETQRHLLLSTTRLILRTRPVVLVSILDITERKRAEDALERERRDYQTIIDAAPVMVAYKSKDDHFVRVNAAFAEFVGLPKEEIIGKTTFDIVKQPDVAQRGRDHDLEVIRTGKPVLNQTVKWSGVHSQQAIWAVYSKLPFRDPDGSIIGTVSFIMDINERKKAEESLLQSEAELRFVTDHIPAFIAHCDENRVYRFVNKPYAELFGLQPVDVIGKHVKAVLGEEAYAHSGPYMDSVLAGQPVSYELDLPVAAAGPRMVHVTYVPERDPTGRVAGFIAVIIDIGERKKLEDQLRQAQKLEGIGQLASGIAHDFNNVLGAMIGFAGVLQMKIAAGDPLQHYVDEIVAAGERGADITRQILLFSRKQVTELKPERLNGIVQGLEKMLRRLLPESIDLAQDLTGEDPVILADAGQIVQVLLNLVTNARDAIVGNGRICIATGRQRMDRSFVEAQGYGEPGEYAVITVSDTGHGMDAPTRGRIFEPFFTTKEPGKGTGLGLAVVHGIVRQHQGYVNIYSEVGKGTVIRVYLPLAGTAVVAGAPPPAVPAQITGGSETILVAEDDGVLRKLTRTVLGQYGYTVIEAEDGVDAVAKFAANREAIRLVILDGLMPKMGGLEALSEIRRNSHDIKAIFMSGYDEKIFSGGALQDQTAVYIQKPVLIDDLLRTVREVLDR